MLKIRPGRFRIFPLQSLESAGDSMLSFFESTQPSGHQRALQLHLRQGRRKAPGPHPPSFPIPTQNPETGADPQKAGQTLRWNQKFFIEEVGFPVTGEDVYKRQGFTLLVSSNLTPSAGSPLRFQRRAAFFENRFGCRTLCRCDSH